MSQMVFQDLKKSDSRTLSFTMSPTRVTYANILRRAIQTEVSVLGFRADMTDHGSTTDVKVFKNSTPMSNEMLADRVGLLPITMPLDAAGWDKDKIIFRLKVVNDTDQVRLVTASDFECLENRADSEERVRIPNTQFFYPDRVSGETCLLAVLKPKVEGQEPEEIHLEAYATLGKGREHTRFNPTSQCSYGYTRDEDQARINTLWVNWLRDQKKVDPKELEKDPPRKSMLDREFRSLEIYRCYKEDVDGEPFSYDFTVETLGTLPVHTIIYEALNAVAAMAEKYTSIDRGDLPDTLDIRPADSRLKGFDFWFSGEDHTLGNLFQTWLVDNQQAAEITYAGYKVPHPLRDEMVLRIGVEDGKVESARLAIAKTAQATSDMFRGWAQEWANTTESAGLQAHGERKTAWEAHETTKQSEAAKAKAKAKAKVKTRA